MENINNMFLLNIEMLFETKGIKDFLSIKQGTFQKDTIDFNLIHELDILNNYGKT